ncbi:MAG: hypothetical protein HZC11_01135, partial [Nitrospirae bacterium]|nr:hypothetical protein [Nitrospirota bacterium]
RLYVAAMWRDGLWQLEKDKWTQLKDDEFISNVAVDPTDPNRIAITTQWGPWSDVTFASGVWISKDGGKTWSQQNEGLSCLRGRAIAFNPHNTEQLIFGSDGCGYFVTQWQNTDFHALLFNAL